MSSDKEIAWAHLRCFVELVDVDCDAVDSVKTTFQSRHSEGTAEL